ncbi:UNVERIFIED_CONTAM: hypothetical protein Slati_3757500 [Sesamum latifolium]|uniref:Reverse transcriptase RNase H-like domain-containing protein n=1 Tax=Sesamum latifolium TaxID=2727402 RepID=A0AAW2U557_9LAMI
MSNELEFDEPAKNRLELKLEMGVLKLKLKLEILAELEPFAPLTQTPIYYISKVLNGAESRYSPIEKMALALVITTRKLRPYFLSHPVGVRTNTSLKQVLGKPEASGPLVKWAIELSEMTQEKSSKAEPWILHVDGSSNTQGSGAGIVITSPRGEDLEFAKTFDFRASNNEAEYEALVSGEYEAKEESMMQYLQQIEEIKMKFKSFELQQIPRKKTLKQIICPNWPVH